MPVILGQKFLPTWEGRPPRMAPEDEEIWRRYASQARQGALAFYFDVGLGGDFKVPPGTTPEMAAMWFRNTQKRADVVVDYGVGWMIIELRLNATSAAIGRLLMYRDLWQADPPDNRPVLVRLVTNREDRDVRTLSTKLDIDYVVI